MKPQNAQAAQTMCLLCFLWFRPPREQAMLLEMTAIKCGDVVCITYFDGSLLE